MHCSVHGVIERTKSVLGQSTLSTTRRVMNPSTSLPLVLLPKQTTRVQHYLRNSGDLRGSFVLFPPPHQNIGYSPGRQ